MVRKIQITIVEFEEVKVFNPLKFWKGSQMVERFVSKSTEVFPITFGEVGLFDLYRVKHRIEWAFHLINPDSKITSSIAEGMVSTLKLGHPIVIKSSDAYGRKREFIMEYNIE